MRTHSIALVLLVALALPAGAQDHLVPDAGAFADPDIYLLKCRDVFALAFEEGVALRALVLESFEKEYVVGLKISNAGAEAFVLEASSSIWDTEILRMYKTGECGPAMTLDGKKIPLEQDETYKALKKQTPEDHRAIKAARRARPLPKEVADGIEKLWENMLLEVRHPKEPEGGADGTTYHFSAFVLGRGVLSGQTWSPEPESKTGRLVQLAETLANFARGSGSLETLKAHLEAAGKAIAAPAR